MTGAEQERADFKVALLETLDKYMTRVDDTDTGIKHVVTYCFPEQLSMKESASFFFRMICRHRDMHGLDSETVLFDPDSIVIGYDIIYQCLSAGIMIYE